MLRSREVDTPDARAARVALSVTTAMHELALHEAFPSLSDGAFDAMRQANTRFAGALRVHDVDAAIAADDQFHAVAVTLSGNAALRTVLEQFTPPLRRAERLRFSSPTGHDSVAQHARVIELSQAGDLEAAVAATRANWQTLAPLLGLPGATPGRA
ncbi:FCD domain-containing protein [Paractinoplanes hotanensis]|uniref:FCD domain-containing protein n=1 Tax=Paractinoplanes hotanensis TaxID=2906497 RepID=A0ABT0YCP1_9ACTN|nr:FCD domain-containing protein [Actinoplanes hotanensis]MCM4083565.1 FCD domain-containing protein [Actinoplanes hotanensis]